MANAFRTTFLQTHEQIFELNSHSDSAQYCFYFCRENVIMADPLLPFGSLILPGLNTQVLVVYPLFCPYTLL
jgi:hypothetical protein